MQTGQFRMASHIILGRTRCRTRSAADMDAVELEKGPGTASAIQTPQNCRKVPSGCALASFHHTPQSSLAMGLLTPLYNRKHCLQHSGSIVVAYTRFCSPKQRSREAEALPGTLALKIRARNEDSQGAFLCQ
jgi:hypothetical protein